jgi:type VI secretion system protein ImpI
MNLILELAGHSPTPDSIRRKVFGTDGGRIGRAPDCDWVLASPYVSRHHATVRFAEGAFYIESTGENGVAVNAPEAMLPQLERRALKNGDRLFIDEFEISVALADSPASLADGAFGAASGALGTATGALGGAAALGTTSGALDPLLNLPGAREPGSAVPEVAWNASSSLADHFTPPRMTPHALPVAEDWNDTGLDRQPARSTAPLRLVTPPPLDLGAAADVTRIPSKSALPGPMAPSAGDFDISPLLHALGLDPASLAPAALDTLSTSVRSVLQGLIDVLRARAQFRSQFRLQDTRVTLTENNPLKFAINAQDALGSLFGDPNPGYMGAADAFDDAFDDMRCHQLATLAGMRAGFASLLARFDPEVLQQRFDRHLKRAGFLAVGAKLRYWDLYAELFEDLSADPNNAFQRMFGEAFADAYERQLEALQNGRPPPVG